MGFTCESLPSDLHKPIVSHQENYGSYPMILWLGCSAPARKEADLLFGGGGDVGGGEKVAGDLWDGGVGRLRGWS